MSKTDRKKSSLSRVSFDIDTSGMSSSKKFQSKTYGSSLKKNKPADAFDFLDLIRDWESIVGSNFSKKTIPLKLKFGTLTILTEHSSYSDHLKFLEFTLIKKIIATYPIFAGKLKKISFYNNSNFFKQKTLQQSKITHQGKKEAAAKVALHPQSPEYIRLKKKSDIIFKEIEDDDVKSSLESLLMQLSPN